jgi:hypothetical protein
LKAGLVDEVSLILRPGIDGRVGIAAVSIESPQTVKSRIAFKPLL